MTNQPQPAAIPGTEGEEFVRDCYRLLLHRDADEEGLAAHLGALKRGLSRERLFYEMRTCPEGFRVRVPVQGLRIGSIRARDLLRQDGAAFLDAVYLALVGRTPSDAEVSAGLRTLGQGAARESVIGVIAASPEAAAVGTRLLGLRSAKVIRKAKNGIRRIGFAGRLIDRVRRHKSARAVRGDAARAPLSSRLRRGRSNLMHINSLADRVDRLERDLRDQADSLRGELRLYEVMRERSGALRTNIAYKQFEDEMRGSREEIMGRLEAYGDVIRRVRERCGEQLFALDLGCGRGEWLELLKTRHGIASLGVDSDPTMLRDCEARGLMTVQADLLAHLRSRASGSVDIVTLFQVAEHLPVSVLLDTLTECLRVLRPGGALIVETPNPENLIVGACNFHMDPTHITKLPPPLLKILVEGAGFAETEILRLHPYGAIPPEKLEGAPEAVRDMAGFFNHGADYAVTAFKTE